jgi:hypothetical protein
MGLSLLACAVLIATQATEAHAYWVGYPLAVALAVGAVLTCSYGSRMTTAAGGAAPRRKRVALATALKLLMGLTIATGLVALAISVIAA